MTIGRVQYFLPQKGFGYIRVENSREEIYVHQKHLKAAIKEGDWVQFEIKEDRHGLYAENVSNLPNTHKKT